MLKILTVKDLLQVPQDQVKRDEEKGEIQIYVNGFKVKDSFSLELTGEQLLSILRRKNQRVLAEAEVRIKVRVGEKEKSVCLQGFIREILIGGVE